MSSITSTAPESPTPSATDVDLGNEDGGDKPPTLRSRMSNISKMYDIDGDGQLDEAERAMRDMDKSNRGYLTNEKVYKMMQEQMETQKQLFHVKRMMFVLLGIVVILALSNFGTAFAAAYLAKDTTTSPDAELLDKATGEKLSTQSSTEEIEIERTTLDETGRRRLADGCTEDEDGNIIECGLGSSLTISERGCRGLKKRCKLGHTVSLKRTWFNDNGDEAGTTTTEICPFTEGRIRRRLTSTLVMSDGGTLTIDPEEDETCRISGDAVLGSVDDFCNHHNDCAGNLKCVKIQKDVDICQFSCEKKRWAMGSSLMDACISDCKMKTCQSIVE